MTIYEFTEILTPWQPSARQDWQLTQIKYHFDITLGKMLQNNPQRADDVEVPYLKAQHIQWNGVRIDELPTMWASPSEVEALRVHLGDLLVCEGGEVGRASIVMNSPPDNCIVQNAVHLVRPKPTGDLRFLRYLLQHATSHQWLDVLCNRSTIAHFTAEKFKEMWMWLPSLSEQHAIANYLDVETARIDTLIKAQEHLLDLLDEKRKTLITHAATKGVNADVSMHDSDVEWLGAIPRHWKLEVARWLFEEVDERSTSGDEELLTVSHLTGVTPRSEKNVYMFMAESTEGYKICLPGDLVVNTLWAWMGAMGVAFQLGVVSPDYHVYRSPGEYDPHYLDYLVRVPAFAKEVTRYSKGVWSSRLRLYPQEFFQIVLPVPPLAEQQEIAYYLTQEITKLDDLRDAANKAMKLLNERRAALITAAVTGQIDVMV